MKISKEIKILSSVAIVAIILSLIIFVFVSRQNQNNQDHIVKTNSSFSMVSNLASAQSFSYGPVDAKVTVVEFFDPECESCAAVAPQIKKEMKYYDGKVRWVFRYMPYHYNSKSAIHVLEAAKKQNLFLEALTLLFERQTEWGEKQVSTLDLIINIVTEIPGINKDQLLKDLKDNQEQVEAIILKDKNEGEQAGVTGTPSFYVNGVLLQRLSLDDLIQKIEEGIK